MAEGWQHADDWKSALELYPPKSEIFPLEVTKLLAGENFSDKRILDYGCGPGDIAQIEEVREKRDQAKLWAGIDITEQFLKDAKHHFPVAMADGTRLPFSSKEFDYVLSFMTYQVIGDIEAAISETARVLRLGGTLIMGIVHPHAEEWDLETKLCYPIAPSTVETPKKWVFNLTDGRSFEVPYHQRPWSKYGWLLKNNGMYVDTVVQPAFTLDNYREGMYAKSEYLFAKATVIRS